jgi:cysteine desulfurase/selenocysteine lyase
MNSGNWHCSTGMKSAEEVMGRLRQEEFPVTREKVWLDTATYGPLPVSNARVQTQFIEAMMLGADTPGRRHWWEGATEVRTKVGEFIGCDPVDIALLRSTGEGISLVSLGLDWRPGDEVVLYDREFPSDVYPFLALADNGVKISFIADRGRHRFDIADVEAAMSDRTRVVCISLVNCYHGFRAPIEQIAELCRKRGCWLLVDAVQGAGVAPVNVASLGADLVSAHGYKTLCSGYGISFCYISPRLREQLRVVAPGWKNIEDAPYVGKQLDYNLRYPDSARRFEPTIQNLAGMYGLGASIDLFQSVGIEQIFDWVKTVTGTLRTALTEHGYQVVSSDRPSEQSGIISAEVPADDKAAVHAALAAQGIRCAMRDGRLRFSCHLFNNYDDIDRLIAALP